MPRQQILDFAELMEARMKVGDERGWTMDGAYRGPLIDRIHRNLAQADEASKRYDFPKLRESLADVANLSMLVETLLPSDSKGESDD